MLERCRATLGVSTLTLGHLENLSRFAVTSAWPPLPQHHQKPPQARPGPLALLLTRVRVPCGRQGPPTLARATSPARPRRAPSTTRYPAARTRSRPGSRNTRDGTLRATPGQAMLLPSASPPRFPPPSASQALRFQRHAVQRPGPTAQPRLVYSLTLHPETQTPATRTPARYGHAPAPRPRPAPPLRARAHSEGGAPGLPSSQVCVFAKVMQP